MTVQKSLPDQPRRTRPQPQIIPLKRLHRILLKAPPLIPPQAILILRPYMRRDTHKVEVAVPNPLEDILQSGLRET
ncbi:hypothetical protein E4U34_000870 [Claviceps purpurea]|nr:hypothetical protein E4U34_000870 [Claviceps purpurea]